MDNTFYKNDIHFLFQKINNSNFLPDEKNNMKDDLTNALNSFADYVDIVVKMEIFCESISAWNSFAEFKFKNFDEERRLQHDKCVLACNTINEICDKIGMKHFCEIDIENRNEVANFAGMVVNNLFLYGINPKTRHNTLSFDCVIEKLKNRKTTIQHIERDEWER